MLVRNEKRGRGGRNGKKETKERDRGEREKRMGKERREGRRYEVMTAEGRDLEKKLNTRSCSSLGGYIKLATSSLETEKIKLLSIPDKNY